MKTSEIKPGVLQGGGYLALPDAHGPHPGVVVIHEVYGLNENIKDIAGRLGTTANTVRNQRCSILKKMEAESVADLVRMVLAERQGDRKCFDL